MGCSTIFFDVHLLLALKVYVHILIFKLKADKYLFVKKIVSPFSLSSQELACGVWIWGLAHVKSLITMREEPQALHDKRQMVVDLHESLEVISWVHNYAQNVYLQRSDICQECDPWVRCRLPRSEWEGEGEKKRAGRWQLGNFTLMQL